MKGSQAAIPRRTGRPNSPKIVGKVRVRTSGRARACSAILGDGCGITVPAVVLRYVIVSRARLLLGAVHLFFKLHNKTDARF